MPFHGAGHAQPPLPFSSTQPSAAAPPSQQPGYPPPPQGPGVPQPVTMPQPEIPPNAELQSEAPPAYRAVVSDEKFNMI